MKLYLLKRIESPEYDECDGFVVAAPIASVARRIASENAKDEGRRTWFMTEETSCKEIGEAKADQKAGIILRSFNAG